MNLKITIGLFSMLLLLAPCKQTRYTEIGMGGAGKLAVKSSDLTLPKKQADYQVAVTAETNEVSTVSSENRTIKQSSLNDAKGLNHNSRKSYKSSFRKLTTSLKQGLKLIPKFNSMNRQEVKQTLKNQKQIFGYEGDNHAMTIGFNILIYSIISAILGLVLMEFIFTEMFFVNFLLNFLTFGGLIGLLLGGLIWVTGVFYKNMQKGGIVFGIILSLIILFLVFLGIIEAAGLSHMS